MELTRVRSKIWNEGDYPPVSRQWRLFTRLYLHDLRSGSGRTLHIVIPARPGSDISSAIVTHVTCQGSSHAAYAATSLITLSAHIELILSVMAVLTPGSGHWLSLFSAQGTLRAPQRAPPPDITLTVCNCIWGEVAQISAQSFALISFHKNPSPFWANNKLVEWGFFIYRWGVPMNTVKYCEIEIFN